MEMDETSLSWGCFIVIFVIVIGAIFWFWPSGDLEDFENSRETIVAGEADPAQVKALQSQIDRYREELAAARYRERCYLVTIVVFLIANVGMITYMLGRHRSTRQVKPAITDLG